MTLTSAKENSHHHDDQQQLPVIIVGAGPCGLVAALALQKYGVPFVIIEKASRSKLCSNAGSGFELSPTAVDILRNRLGINISKFITYYRGLALVTMEGKLIREFLISNDFDGGSVNRAELQIHLLQILFPTSQDEEGILFCGSGIESYKEVLAADQEGTATTTKAGGGNVIATLASGESIYGCLLLACDGIHSRCRAVLHGGYDTNRDWETNTKTGQTKDPLHFCKAICYWGKTRAPRGTDLEVEFAKFQRLAKADKNGKDLDSSAGLDASLIALPTSRAPSSFFCFPSNDGTMLNWAFMIRSEKSESFSKKNDGTDLTRRGGGPLTEDEKKCLFEFVGAAGHNSPSGPKTANVVQGVRDFPLVEKLIANTPAEDITEAGLFDRENLSLSFTSESKLVALLGDAAHPQTPALGQGVNMAICDAYVYATNIALALETTKTTKTAQITITTTQKLQEAMARSDTDRRFKQAKKVVRQARTACNLSVSQNVFVKSILYLYSKFATTEALMNQIVKDDISNRDYLKHLDERLCSPKEQEALRQKA